MNHKKISFLISLIFFAYFVGFGLSVPLLSVWYKKYLNFSGYEIGLLTAIAPLSTLVSLNIIGAIVDYLGKTTLVFIVLILGSIANLLILFHARDFWLIFISISLFSFFHVPIMSILNASMLHYFGTNHFSQFGRTRAWGTVGFLVANFIIVQFLPENNLQLFFIIHAVCLSLILFMVPWLPHFPSSMHKHRLSDIINAVRVPIMAKLALAIIWQQIAFAAIDSYVSIYILIQGGSPAFASFAWGLGALLEVWVMRYSGHFVERYSTKSFILIGIAATIFRLLAYSFPLPLWAILLVQLSHSLAFSGVYLGTIYLVGQIIPEQARALSQSFLDSFVRRGGITIGSLLGGLIYQHYDIYTLYACMAVLSLLSFVLVANLLPNRPSLDQ